MKCFICENADMTLYFNKEFTNLLSKGEYWKNHRYVKCPDCGMVIDLDIYELSKTEWSSKVNDLHGEKNYFGTESDPDDPEWINRLHRQANTIVELIDNSIIDVDKAVDYGCGDGKLSDFINEKYCELKNKKLDKLLVGKYEKYVTYKNASGYIAEEEMKEKTFDFVVSCSVFEHLIGIKDVEEVVSYVNENGVLAIHTLICEAVPKDPEWYYLLPGHCTLWTNKAMEKLYNMYHFVGCAYNVEARMWFFFKDKEKYRRLQEKNSNMTGTWVLSDQFVDYWKQKPYR